MSNHAPPDQARIVIVGGGFAGLMLLYYLSKMGLGEGVVLCEKDTLLSGITRYTAGQVMLSMDFELHVLMSRFTLEEIDRWKQEWENMSPDTEFNPYRMRRGMLSIYPGKSFDQKLKDRWEMLIKKGVHVEQWTKEYIMDRVPFLNVSGVDKGLFCGSDCMIEPSEIRKLCVKFAKSKGATIVEKCRVIDIIVEENKVRGVIVKDTEGPSDKYKIKSEVVVNAAGLEAIKVGDMAGISLGHVLDIKRWRFNGYTKPLKPEFRLIPTDVPIIEIMSDNPQEWIYVGPHPDNRAPYIDFTIGEFPDCLREDLGPQRADFERGILMVLDDVCLECVDESTCSTSNKSLKDCDCEYSWRDVLDHRMPKLFSMDECIKYYKGNIRKDDPISIYDKEKSGGSRRCKVRQAEKIYLPILGRVDDIGGPEGYFLSVGFGGLGITHGPISGCLVSMEIGEFLGDGDSSSEPFMKASMYIEQGGYTMRNFRLSRFSGSVQQNIAQREGNRPITSIGVRFKEKHKERVQYTTVRERPDLYDWHHWEYKEDLPMYEKLVRKAVKELGTPRVLECGIGTGRVAIHLVRKITNIDVYGIDNSPKMLERLAHNVRRELQDEQRNRIIYKYGDMRDIDKVFGGMRFPIIYAAYSTFNYLLHIHDQEEALNQFWKHLVVDGMLVLEVLGFAYQDNWLVVADEPVEYKDPVKEGEGGEIGYNYIVMKRSNKFDPSTQIATEIRRYMCYEYNGKARYEEGETADVEVNLEWKNRFFFVSELILLLERIGFSDIRVYGDYYLKRGYEGKDPFPIIIARKHK